MIKEKWHDNLTSIDSDTARLAMNSAYFLQTMQSTIDDISNNKAINDWSPDCTMNKPSPGIFLSNFTDRLNYTKQIHDCKHEVEIKMHHNSDNPGIPIQRLDLSTREPRNVPAEYRDFELSQKAQMLVRNSDSSFIDLYNVYKNTNKLSRLAGAIAIMHAVYESKNFEEKVLTKKPTDKEFNTKTIKNTRHYLRSPMIMLDNKGIDHIFSLLPISVFE